MITLPAEIEKAIRSQAQAEMPNECCGYLGGSRSGENVTIASRYPMTNIDHSPEHFSFDPAEQFATFKSARENGEDLVANYHSHPETPARMSEEDIRLANDTSVSYFIYSVSDDRLKAFSVDRNRNVTEIPVRITS